MRVQVVIKFPKDNSNAGPEYIKMRPVDFPDQQPLQPKKGERYFWCNISTSVVQEFTTELDGTVNITTENSTYMCYTDEEEDVLSLALAYGLDEQSYQPNGSRYFGQDARPHMLGQYYEPGQPN